MDRHRARGAVAGEVAEGRLSDIPSTSRRDAGYSQTMMTLLLLSACTEPPGGWGYGTENGVNTDFNSPPPEDAGDTGDIKDTGKAGDTGDTGDSG